MTMKRNPLYRTPTDLSCWLRDNIHLVAVLTAILFMFVILLSAIIYRSTKPTPEPTKELVSFTADLLGEPYTLEVEGPYDLADQGGERGNLYIITATWTINMDEKLYMEGFYGQE